MALSRPSPPFGRSGYRRGEKRRTKNKNPCTIASALRQKLGAIDDENTQVAAGKHT
ncbi:hypothetical protein QUB63_02730 [Microcoleus sp. ARI1-B5]|uniref:hypothetical protein n=1 Tax=unclassified Microcoleus TaxID=2642155 RepID=UPI002FD4F901